MGDPRQRALVHARMVAPLMPRWNCRLNRIGFPVDLELRRGQTKPGRGEALYMAEVDRLRELLRTVNGIGDLPITDPYSLAQNFLDLVRLEGDSDVARSVLGQVDRHRARAYKAFVARYNRMFTGARSVYDPDSDRETSLPVSLNLCSPNDVVAYLDAYGPLLDGERIRVLSRVIYLGSQGLTVDRGVEKAYPHGIRCFYGKFAGFFEINGQWWVVPYRGR